MKNMMRLGLSLAIAVGMLNAAAASADASGTICSTTGNGPACAGGHGFQYTGQFKASLIGTTGGGSPHAVLTSGFVQVTCTGSEVEGTVTNASTGTGQISKLTFSGCTNNINGGPCTAVTSAWVGNPWHVTATASGGGSGQLHVANVTGSYTCNILFANRTCFYQASEATVDLFGSHTPTIEAVGIALTKERSDGLCSTSASLEARYEITTPTSLWVT